MATAGSIVVDLLMRTGAFETDTKRAEKRMRELQKTAKQVGVAIGTAFVGVGTAVAVGLKTSIDRMDELSKAASRVQMPTEEFSKLAYAGELADVSVQDLQGSLGKLSKASAMALKDTSEQAKVFRALGISVKDASGNLRSSSDLLMDFADAFKVLGDSPEMMAAGMVLFGRSFQNIIPLIKDGSQGLREAGAEAEALGIVLDTQTGKAAEQFNDDLTRLKSGMDALFMTIAQQLLPDLLRLTDNLVQLTKDGDAAARTAEGLSNALQVVGSVIDFAVITPIRVLGDVVEGTTTAIIGMVESLRGLASMDLNQIKAGFNVWKEGAGLAVFGSERTAKPAAPSRVPGQPFSLPDSMMRPLVDGNATASRLRGVFGGAGAKAKRGGGSGKSEAQREAESLQRSYESMNARLSEQLALFGQTGEAAKLRYELEHGELAKLEPLKKQELRQKAEKLDAMELEAKLQDAADEAVREHTRMVEEGIAATDRLIGDMRFELDLLSMSNDERAKAIALRYADANATDEQRRAIADLAVEMERANELTSFMDDFRQNAIGALSDFVTGAKSAKEAFTDFFDSLAERITQMIAERWIEQLFGSMGSTGQGTSGGNMIGSLFGAMFGGGRAGGGDTMPGNAYLVGENGPEMFVPRTAGTVLTADQTAGFRGGNGRSFKQTLNVTIAGRPDKSTPEQIARASAREGVRAISRTGR